MKTGSCHCGQVAFEVTGKLSPIYKCYCGTCRKLSGGAFSMVTRVDSEGFRLLKGEESLHTYESSPGKVRYYCKSCCSPVFVKVTSQPEFVRLRLGLLDYEPEVEMAGHIWVSEKPDWIKVEDSLPADDEWPV